MSEAREFWISKDHVDEYCSDCGYGVATDKKKIDGNDWTENIHVIEFSAVQKLDLRCKSAEDYLVTLKADNDRLRSALDQIGRGGSFDASSIHDMRIAREALKL